mgnify:CR=1 FL=1
MHAYDPTTDDLLATAEEIAATETRVSRADGTRLTSGSERGDDGPTTFDPAQEMKHLDGDGAPTDLGKPMPSTGGSRGGPRPYVMPDALGRLHSQVGDARRRDDDADLAEPKAAAKAWQAFIAAADDAQSLARSIPQAMSKAARAREDALASAGDEPVVLPSVEDARAHAEHKAADALRHALDLRKAYDVVVEETRGDRRAALAASVPEAAADLLGAVRDVEARLAALRSGVAALVDLAADEGGASVVAARLPAASRLDLEPLVEEVKALAAVAEKPTAPRLVPPLAERQAIAAAARHVVGGIPDALVALAVREEDEGWQHTSLAKHVPRHLREAHRQGAAHRA